ncbi:cation:proton antiporter [Elioraea sp.]|uniref:cation:proton antiporter domain-containing protein n=1 Tax=Elioraea sp. TaxID=2185103 RepID=UPI0025B841F8|nr:cation:proton antiporter [Elioraea sp.]
MKLQLSDTNDGLVALGLTLLSYGVAEIYRYGFVAVFAAAVTLRAAGCAHRYHEELHAFAERIERVAITPVLVCFGAAIAEGLVLGSIEWAAIAVALVTLPALRPVAAFVILIGTSSPRRCGAR